MKKLPFAALLSAALVSLTMLSSPAHAYDDRGPRGYDRHHGYYDHHAERQARAYRRAQREHYREMERRRQHAWAARHHAPRFDRDGDGVPNRYDRRPNNPYRY